VPVTEPAPEKGLGHYIVLGLSAALLVAVLALAVVVIIVPKLSGATPLTVLTSSMEPSLPPGTLIVVQPVDTADLAVGDVATYQIRSGEPEVITHRIIAISEATTGARSFEFQGDNNSDPDPDPILAEQIQGRVTYSIPLIGWVNMAVNGENRSWIIPALAIGLFSYAGYMLVGGIISSVRARRAGSAVEVPKVSSAEDA
jgi:signal peptidase